MSLLLFESTDGRLRGLSIYDADPSWTLEPPSETGSRIAPRCDNGEGEGCWVILDSRRSLWGGLLRRGDAPYNDCLPPSESLLREAFQDQDHPREILSFMNQEAESGFYNPFNAVVGSIGGEVLCLKQSFQSSRTEVHEGAHLLEDNGELDSPSDPALGSLIEDFPTYDRRKDLAMNRDGSGDLQLSTDSGPRPTRFAMVFDWDREDLRVDFCSGYPPESEWTSRRVNDPVA